MQISSFLIVAMPWIAGGLAALCLREIAKLINNKTTLNKPSLPTVLVFGLGGFLGYLVLGYVLSALNTLALPALTLLVNCWLFAVILLTLIPLWRWPQSQLHQSIETSWPMISALVFLFVYAGYMQSQNPVFGWDALNHWARKAAELALHSSLSEHATLDYEETSRHPKTIVFITTWAGWVNHQVAGLGAATPWLLCMVSVCLVGYGYVYAITQSEMLGALCALLLVTLPLAEAHLLIIGYAELWLTTTVVTGILFISLGIQHQNTHSIAVGLFVATLAATVKNIGQGYALCVWVAFAVTVIIRNLKLTATLALFVVISGYLLWISGFAFDTLGIRVYWSPENMEFFFGGRAMEAALNSPLQVAVNEVYSWLVNQTYNTAGLALLFVGVSQIRLFIPRKTSESCQPAGKIDKSMRTDESIKFMMLACLLFLGMLTMSQVFLPFSYIHALPNGDTGNSRFSLPLAAISVPIAVVAFHRTMNSTLVIRQL